jgi:GGDEF domain-containing protein
VRALIEDIISISTLMICTFLSTMVVGIFMLQVWLTDRRHAAAGYWCVSMWVGSLCTLLYALRPVGFPLLTVGLSNALAAFAYALMWAGFRVFDRRRVHLPVVLTGPALWGLAYLFLPQVSGDVNNRIILSSVIITTYSLWMGVDIWRGRGGERLPTRTMSAVFFLTHGVIYSLRIPMAILTPAQLAHGTAYSAWFAVFSLELFAHTILAAVAMLVLIKERGEALYRQASRTDALTGIPNRGSFLEDIQTRLSGMLFCRFGGEEFALFAPVHDIARAEAFAEMLRRETAGIAIASGAGDIRMSVSIGLADVATFGADFDRLHSAADSALYAAKEAGRDRVMRATPSAGLPDMAGRMRAADAPPASTALSA